ncbi:MAG: hypothetical protein JO241_09905, partial [Candidatus Eremiobacteraeota bacterium]|nr:hypothetical protein [Candidatus Eremiobacteraeota bacterium]
MRRLLWFAALLALVACGGGRPYVPLPATGTLPNGPSFLDDDTDKVPCPRSAAHGVPLVIHDRSGLPIRRLTLYFTSSVPSNLAQFQFLNRDGTMTTFAIGNRAQPFPLFRCFPGSLARGGRRFTFPLLPGGRVWIVFGKLPIAGAANGQFVGPTGWIRGKAGFDVPYDTVELSDNNPGIFVNMTRVDMLGLPMQLRVLPPGKSKPWAAVGEKTDQYVRLLRELRGDAPFGQTVVLVRPLRVPRIINPSHLPNFPDVFNSASYYPGGFINKVAGYYQNPPAAITYSTAYKSYCPGSWSAGSTGSAFTFTQGGQTNTYPNSQLTTNYIFADSPAYSANTCTYLLDKILLQELNRGVAMTASHPVTAPSSFYPKGTINNQYACLLHNYSLHFATYAFAYDDAANQASTITNPSPRLVELTIGRMPRG